MKELRKMASKNIVLAIAGNKSDMDKLRQVDLKESERLVLISARSCAARLYSLRLFLHSFCGRSSLNPRRDSCSATAGLITQG